MDFSEMGGRIRKHRQLKSMTQDVLAEKSVFLLLISE